MRVTVFTKPICQGCKATKRKLEQMDIDYDTQELDEESAARFLSIGLMSAPIVEVDFGFGATWSWGGHAPSQLERLDHAFDCDDPICTKCESILAA